MAVFLTEQVSPECLDDHPPCCLSRPGANTTPPALSLVCPCPCPYCLAHTVQAEAAEAAANAPPEKKARVDD